MWEEGSQAELWEVNQQAAGHLERKNAKLLNSLLEVHSWGEAACKNKPGLQRKWLWGGAWGRARLGHGCWDRA